MMQIENQKVNREKYYFVGYSPDLEKYVLACTISRILRQFVPQRIVFDESFMDNGDFDPDDERCFWVCQKLDTGHQGYIDAGSFTMLDIR